MSLTKTLLRKYKLSGAALDELCVYAREHPRKENIIKNDIKDPSLPDPYLNRYRKKNEINKAFNVGGIHSFLLVYTTKKHYTFISRYRNGKMRHLEVTKEVGGNHVLYRDAVIIALDYFSTFLEEMNYLLGDIVNE